MPELTLELDEIFSWSDAALVAERFGDGCVFLAGDAEHLMAPAGGFGMSVGIQDAHNLAWKLAAVLHGSAGPALLAGYEAERAPISRLMTEQMMRNAISARAVSLASAEASASSSATRAPLGRPEFLREHALVFGATYESSVIVPNGTAPVHGAKPVTDYVPNGRPGSRAPHVWLDRGGERIFTLDLFDTAFALLAGPRGRAWCEAVEAIAGELHIPLRAYVLGLGGGVVDTEGAWAHRYGVDPDGAVLVRPDGCVAWRSTAAAKAAQSELPDVLRTGVGKGALGDVGSSAPTRVQRRDDLWTSATTNV